MIRKLGKDIAIYGVGDLVFKLAAFFVFPIYTHLFHVDDFGIITLLTVTAGLVGIVINLGINNSVQRFYWDPETRKADQPVIVTTGLVQLVTVGVLVLLLSVVIVYNSRDFILKRYNIEWVLLSFALATVLAEQILQYSLDTVRLHFKPFRFLTISFTKNLLGVCLGLWFIIGEGMGLYGFFLGALLAPVISIPLALWFIRHDLVPRIDKKVWKKLFHFGYPFLFMSIAYWIFGSMDRWMLAELSTTSEVGLFGVAFKFAAVVSFASTAFAQAWSPFAIKLFRDDPQYRTSYSRIFSIWFFLIALLALGISLFSRELLVALTPKEYWNAAGIMGVVTAGVALHGTTLLTSIGISLEKKTKYLTLGAVLAAVANLLLNLLLIPLFGALGAGFSTLISYGILTGSFLYWTQRLHTLPLEKGKLLFSCAIVLAAVFIPFLFTDNSLSYVIIGVKGIIMTLIASGALFFGIVDKGFIRNLIRKKPVVVTASASELKP